MKMYGTAIIKIRGCWMTRRANDEEGIYNLIVAEFGHEEAAEAASWCAEAPIGSEYASGNPDVEIWIED